MTNSPTSDVPRVIVLGNQKSGTSAIAHLLANLCSLTKSIDVPRRRRRESYAVVRGQMTFAEFARRRTGLFDAQLVKIPALTFVADQVVARFPTCGVVFVLRDPRDNIRSLLNRRGIPGNLAKLGWRERLRLRGRLTADARMWGDETGNYITVLAQRWTKAADALAALGARAQLLKYEQFAANKQSSLSDLAHRLNLPEKNEIAAQLDVQYQPAGDRGITWIEFFGPKNLRTIEETCGARMAQFGYLPSHP